jgi:hypothetical protein
VFDKAAPPTGRRPTAVWKSYPVPYEVATAVASGTSRIRAFRKYDGVSMNALALTTSIVAERMLQIEEGANPTDDELKDISDAPAVPVSMLAGMFR